jgi:hypothetical protein
MMSNLPLDKRVIPRTEQERDRVPKRRHHAASQRPRHDSGHVPVSRGRGSHVARGGRVVAHAPHARDAVVYQARQTQRSARP